MPEPLSEEKLAELAILSNPISHKEVLSLLAEVRLGREALKALEAMVAEARKFGYSETVPAFVVEAHKAEIILRKAGRR